MKDNKGLLPFRTVGWRIYQGTLNQSVNFCKAIYTKPLLVCLFFFFAGGGGGHF